MGVLNDNFAIIRKIERILWPESSFEIQNTYIHPEDYLWIKKTPWPFGAYKKLSKVSGISAFPDTRISTWLAVVRQKGKGIKKRIGLFCRYPFESPTFASINADFYFDKNYFGILLYLKDARAIVVKFIQKEDEESILQIRREAESLKMANKVQHPVVKTPELLMSHFRDGLFFFEQDLIHGDDLHFLSAEELSNVYKHVFDFMFLWYNDRGVSCVLPKKEEDVITYIRNAQEVKVKDDLLLRYETLLKKEKKMLLGRIHGDLWLNNILVDNKKKLIWLIDWGESGIDYLAKDFKNNMGEASAFFSRIIEYWKFKTEDLYDLREQIFIAEFDVLSSLIRNHLIEQRHDSYFASKLKTSLERLVALDQDLEKIF